jgi:DNA-directed RNA polymerase specialized sigma24 family protein
MPHTLKTLPKRARAASRKPPSKQPDADWAAALRGDRAAFEAAVASYIGELLDAAKRELRYRRAVGDFGPDDLTAEELVGEVLIRAWYDRRRRPPSLAVRTWLLALLFRVAKSLAQRERRFRKLASISLEAPTPPEPIYDDDEEFWEWYQPDDLTRWEDVVDAPVATPEAVAAADEELVRGVDPAQREAFLLFELYRVPLPEVAVALGRSVKEAARLIEEARNRFGLASGEQMS